jgi:hypothetical protein
MFAPHASPRTTRPLAIAAVLLLLGLPSGSVAAAEGDLHVTLDYAVEPSLRTCWQEEEFRRSVSQRIGYDPFQDQAALNVRVRVGGTAAAVDGHVEWRKPSGLLMGERRFVAKDGNCAKLMTEMSCAVGLQIELLRPKVPGAATATARTSGPTSGATDRPPGATVTTDPAAATVTRPPAPLAPPPKAPPPADSGSQLPPATASAWLLWAGVGPSLAWRSSPHITPDLRVFVTARRGDLSLEIAASGTYPSSERRWDGSGFRHTQLGGSLALCGHRAWLSGCTVGRAGAALVRGLEVDRPRSPNGFLAQAGLRFAAAAPIGRRWQLAAHLDGLALLTPSRVTLNQATVWDMPRLGVTAGLDLAVRFR